ncbi:MAG TPA: sugar phosphate isomerase/epimerase family protein [Pirellulales bacterium]|nr:sugar phosphate isomerase/epimerase family protein [Pirellulales bacterium]
MSSMSTVSDRLAVCSWSLAPNTAAELISQLGQIGLLRTQIELGPVRDDAVWSDAKARLDDAGVQLTGGMFRTLGEDYSTLETIRETGGVVPDSTWEANWAAIQKLPAVMLDLQIDSVMFHAGFLPHETSDPNHAKLTDRLRQIARLFARDGITVAFETGQESASSLNAFLDSLGEDNAKVNFDPANMILYNMGDPVAAVRELGPRVHSVHLKDANYTKTPGEWGEEVVLGTGEVDWPSFFQALDDIGFEGYLAIEREAGASRIEDIRTAVEFVRANYG